MTVLIDTVSFENSTGTVVIDDTDFEYLHNYFYREKKRCLNLIITTVALNFMMNNSKIQFTKIFIKSIN